MRIVIDIQGAQGLSRHRGIGRYCLHFALEFVRQRGHNEVFLALNGAFVDSIAWLRAEFDGLLSQENLVVWSAPGPCPALDPAAEPRRRQAEIIREAFLAELEPDWIIVCSLFEGLGDDVCVSIGRLHRLPTAVILYDLIPWIYPDIYYLRDERSGVWYRYQLDQLRRADVLLAISSSSRREAIDYLGFDRARVFNILAGADKRFAPRRLTAADWEILARKYGLRRPFVMYTGEIERRKNVEGLIRGFARLPTSVRTKSQLAIVCRVSEPDRARLLALAQEAGLAKDAVVLTGFVPDDDLIKLYNACELFVFPSWHEGFGLPVLEAMQCGKPVLAANRASLPEVVAREDALFDPFDLDDMAAKIERALTDSAFRTSLAAHGLESSKQFSWAETARRAWAALEQSASLCPQKVATWGLVRPQLAYVSPLPPEPSGIADYSAELLRDLTRHYRIDVVVKDPKTMSDDYVRATCGVISVEEFRRTAGRYERILYHFGNSEFHEHMFDLVEEWPGVVVLHDFFLSSIQQWSEAHQWRRFCWTRALQISHGYPAVVERFLEPDAAKVVYRYPANLSVLQAALGVIVHSDFSRHLAQSWYGEAAAKHWAVIPLLRAPEVGIDRAGARKRLGVPEDALLVCSFGVLGQIKLNHRLLEAWLASTLAHRTDARLVFVGKAVGEYGERLHRHIRESGVKNIQITGWADAKDYRDWLAAADVAVQLRALSRGETSAAVLDCMNFGLATIVNAHGSLAELDPQAVWLLPDEFSDAELSEALKTLAQNPGRRQDLGQRARAVVRKRHNPRRCAEQYAAAIEGFYRQAAQGLPGAKRHLATQAESKLAELARLLAQNHPPKPRRRQWLVDISPLVRHDLKTGIQRVVRAILRQWLLQPLAGFQVEPVYAPDGMIGYRYARKFACRLLGIPDDWAEDEPVEAWPGDVFLGLDLALHDVPRNLEVLSSWHRRGVKIYFVVYDLLPVLQPQFFPDDQRDIFFQWLETISQFDGAVTISRSVADELHEWLRVFGPERRRPFRLHWFHLGADIMTSAPTFGLPANAERILQALRARPTFLMVATIEPRKGHTLVLDAMERLWKSGVDVNLAIVGKQGWMVEPLIERLRAHPQLSQRLFWVEAISDEFLDKVYAASSAVVVASEAEGFGLPLIEAARHGRPIIARDIPVFREVAGSHAEYFPAGATSQALAEVLRDWLNRYAQGQVTDSKSMPYLTWQESARQLFAALTSKEPYLQWLPDGIRRYLGNDPRLYTQVGKPFARSMRTTGQAGFLIYGPYAALKSGLYRITVCGTAACMTGDECLHVCCNGGKRQLLHTPLRAGNAGPWQYQVTLELKQDIPDIEIRIWVSWKTEMAVDRIELLPVLNEAASEQLCKEMFAEDPSFALGSASGRA